MARSHSHDWEDKLMNEHNPAHEKQVEDQLKVIGKRSVIQTWSIIAWCAGALFWGGYAYSRFVTMDQHLESIDAKMDRLADVETIRQRQLDNIHRLELMERTVQDLLKDLPRR